MSEKTNISMLNFSKFDIKDKDLRKYLVRIKDSEFEVLRPHYQISDIFMDVGKKKQYKIPMTSTSAVGLTSPFKLKVNGETYTSLDMLIKDSIDGEVLDQTSLQNFTLVNMLRLARTEIAWVRDKLERPDVWFFIKRNGPTDIYNIYDYYEDLINTSINLFRNGLLRSNNIKLILS